MSQELKEAVDLEKRASEIRTAVLSDVKFMAGVRRSQQEEQTGDQGVAWADVKRELGLI